MYVKYEMKKDKYPIKIMCKWKKKSKKNFKQYSKCIARPHCHKKLLKTYFFQNKFTQKNKDKKIISLAEFFFFFFLFFFYLSSQFINISI